MLSIYDTTLRDGSQGEGVSFTVEDKLKIASALDEVGVHYIEGGWPGSNPKDAAFFARAGGLELGQARLCAFGATRRPERPADEDPNLRALVDSSAPVTTIFGKASVRQVENVLRTTRGENLRMIEESCAFLRAAGREVIFDAEHFFDGAEEDLDYALKTVRAAERGGASWIVLCDTNGGCLPWTIERRVQQVTAFTPVPLGIHCHDDSGCAVANSLAAVRSGVRMVQGTINGYGERCGNADLCAVIPDLQLKMKHTLLGADGLRGLVHLSAFVDDLANVTPRGQRPFVGRCAFAHKAGVHVAAMRRDPDSYQHVDPSLVGNRMRTVVSELSGRGNVQTTAERIGLELEAGADRSALEDIKRREAEGYAYDAAEASVELLLARATPDYRAPFEVLDYSVMTRGDATASARSRGHTVATVKMRIDAESVHTVAEGIGPVSALDGALRKALREAYPEVTTIRLVDYKVRILDPDRATSATTRVLIESQAREHRWSVVGASPNIVEASLLALVDALEYGLSSVAPPRAQPSRDPSTGTGRQLPVATTSETRT